MTGAPARIYLDNAATSFPKPAATYTAVERALRENGAAYGRGASRPAVETQRVVERCRERLARLLGAPSPRHVIFTFNGTDSLNMALHGMIRTGGHVVTTTWEHNSVLRPLRRLQDTHGITTSLVDSHFAGRIDPLSVINAVREETLLVVLNHASNVTGVLQPVEEILSGIRAKQLPRCRIVVDVAQSAGHVPVPQFLRLGADAVACPGHKGLLGPLGTGVLALREGIEQEMAPLRQGGTGTASESDVQPLTLPDLYESGNHNVPGLWGLEAGVEWIQEHAPEELRRIEIERTGQLIGGLLACPGVIVYGDPDPANRVGVVSFNIAGMEPQVVASILDQHFGIEVRAGLHCAPRAHQALGTAQLGGTVRMSVGHFTTADEIDQALEALAQIAAAV